MNDGMSGGISEYDELYNPENLLAIIRDLKERVQRLELKDVDAEALSDISANLGDIYEGTIITEEVPVTAAPDVTADVALSIDSSTKVVTCSPEGGQRVPLMDADGTFTTHYLTSAITYDASGLATDKYIDWYIYYDTSTDPPVLKLYPSVWTNDTTRSEAQTTISGVVFLASDVRKRFISVGKIPSAGDPWIGGKFVSWGGLVNGATVGHSAVFLDSTGQSVGDGGALAGIVTKVLTSQFDKTNNTLAPVTGLSVNVVAGKTYIFQMMMFIHESTGTNVGWQLGIDGTCSASSLTASMYIYGQGYTEPTDALGEIIYAAEFGSDVYAPMLVNGTITVSSSGTLYPTFAQLSTDAAASSVGVNSSFVLIPV